MTWSFAPAVDVAVGETVMIPLQIQTFNNATLSLELKVYPLSSNVEGVEDLQTGVVSIPGLIVILDKTSAAVSSDDVVNNKVQDTGNGWGVREIANLTVSALETAKPGTYDFEILVQQEIEYGGGHGEIYPIQITVVEK